jgi:hypothetical protein
MAIEKRDGMMEEIEATETVEESVIEPVTIDTEKMPELKVGDVVRFKVTSIDDGMATAEYDHGDSKKTSIRAMADEYE